MARERTWSVAVPPRVEKALTAAPAHEQRRLRAALDELQGGLAGDVKKLRGRPGVYRRRIGDWRIIFEVDVAQRHIDVLRVARRGGVYRD